MAHTTRSTKILQPAERLAVSADPRLAFAVKLGQALHRYGTPTHRLEQAMNRVLERLEVEGYFFSTPTGLFVSFGAPEEARTGMIRVSASELHLEKMTRLDELAGRVIRGETDAQEGAREVERIVAAPPRYNAFIRTLSYAFASGSLAVFFNGGWREVITAMLIGLTTGILSFASTRTEDTARLFVPVAAMIGSALAVLAAHFFVPFSVYITTLAGLIVLVPGLSLTIGMRELSTGNLISGTTRLTGAIIIFLEIGFGVALGRQIDKLLPLLSANSYHTLPEPLPFGMLYIALLIVPLCFTVLLNARPKDALWIVFSCVLSFGGARLGASLLGAELGVSLGAVAVGAMSNLYARTQHHPAAVFLLPGLLLLVPGSIGFGGFSKFIERDVVSAIEATFQMILVAISLVTGLLVANLVVRPRTAL